MLQIIIRRKPKIKHSVTEGQCILLSTHFSNVWTGQELPGRIWRSYFLPFIAVMYVG